MLEQFLKTKKLKKYKRSILLAIFLWNLIIYSVPLFLIENKFITLPRSFIYVFSKLICFLLTPLLECTLRGNIIQVNSFAFVIDESCVGYKSFFGEFALIMAIPTKDIKKRLKYAIIFATLMFFINILRVFSTIALYYFLNVNPYFLHNVLWVVLQNIVMIYLAFIFFLRHKDNLLYTF